MSGLFAGITILVVGYAVVLFCLAMIVEALVVYVMFVARWPEHLWVRCLLGLSFLGPVALLFSALIVHSPPYMMIHLLWVWILIIVLVTAALGSASVTLSSAAQRLFWDATDSRITEDAADR